MFRKIIPYILILIALVGFFGTAVRVSAQTPTGTCSIPAFDSSKELCEKNNGKWTPTATQTDPPGFCWNQNADKPIPGYKFEQCIKEKFEWRDTSTGDTISQDKDKSEFEKEITNQSCFSLVRFDVGKCAVKFFYYVLYMPAAFLLYVSATFFNALIALSLGSKLLSDSTFIFTGWAVVRDISNIFFIIVLLYIAIKVIIEAGGHDTKKMIGKVIIMALLINFSMFFTEIIVDTSNVLAQVFYNKINVNTINPDGSTRDYKGGTGTGEKDISGGMVNSFNPTNLMSPEFFIQARIVEVKGKPVQMDYVPTGIMLGIIFVAGAVMLFATYAFFVSALSFVGRLIELFVLIVFSPFAFMSFSVPWLEKTDYIGWDAWFSRLIKVSFMAPIFMFFMYFIFLLINAKIFDNLITSQDKTQTILSVIIPAMVILILLLKATEYAKKGSGAFGEAVMNSAKLATGLVVGGAALTVAGAGRATVGSFMKGASTGDTAAQRFARGESRGRIDQFVGEKLSGTKFDRFQQWTGRKINEDQKKVEGAVHARHELDEATGARFHGKKFSDLTQPERDIIRIKISRNDEGRRQFGKDYSSLKAPEKTLVDSVVGVDTATGNAIAGGLIDTRTSHADHLIKESRDKQGIGSAVMQSARVGSYDIRKLADVVAREQTTGIAKMTMGLTGLIVGGMRGGFKQMGVNLGTAEGKFFKDLGSTITESLKNIKINVDLSHVGEVKKEGDKGGHGGGHH